MLPEAAGRGQVRTNQIVGLVTETTKKNETKEKTMFKYYVEKREN